MSEELRERLADLCHKQWAGWMEYLFGKSTENKDGSVTIPEWAVRRWKRQVETPYEELPTIEMDSDRKEADKFLAILTTRAASEAVCSDDCEHKNGRHCLLSANHCIRRAEDYYRPQQ